MAKQLPNPATMAAKWLAGMQQGGKNWQTGCASGGADLSQNALNQAAVAQQNYARAVQPGGRWYEAMSAGVLQQWRAGCADANALARFQNPKASAKTAYQNFAQKAQPVYQNMRAVAAANNTPQTKVVAALEVLIAAGRHGLNQLEGK